MKIFNTNLHVFFYSIIFVRFFFYLYFFTERKVVMNYKNASVIISVYDKPDFLQLVLDSLKRQSIQNFEIIISEDGCSEKMKHFIENYPFTTKYKHLTQEDIGWRKNKALNNAIRNASGDWLIFIDGDCVLHPRFVEMHLRYAAENLILSGRRIKLDEESSNELMKRKQYNINNLFFTLLKKQILKKGRSLYIEEGLYIAPNSIFAFIRKFRKFGRVLGCNMSFSRNAIYSINGFDETYISPTVGEDTDIAWRFKAAGYKMKSLRNLAVQFHLHHQMNWSSNQKNKDKMLINQKINKYLCDRGLNQA